MEFQWFVQGYILHFFILLDGCTKPFNTHAYTQTTSLILGNKQQTQPKVLRDQYYQWFTFAILIFNFGCLPYFKLALVFSNFVLMLCVQFKTENVKQLQNGSQNHGNNQFLSLLPKQLVNKKFKLLKIIRNITF